MSNRDPYSDWRVCFTCAEATVALSSNDSTTIDTNCLRLCITRSSAEGNSSRSRMSKAFQCRGRCKCGIETQKPTVMLS